MKNFNIVNVLDTDLTCYPDNIFPPGEQKEIIQIGLSMVDLRSLTIVKRVSIPVVPQMSKISQYCTDLTGWTYAKLSRQGVTFAEACRRLVKNGSVGRLLVTDTDDELQPFRNQCALAGVNYPFGDSVLNLSTVFALMADQRRNLPLEAKLAQFGLKFEGLQHRADVDAFNIARLFIELVSKGRLACGNIAKQTS